MSGKATLIIAAGLKDGKPYCEITHKGDVAECIAAIHSTSAAADALKNVLESLCTIPDVESDDTVWDETKTAKFFESVAMILDGGEIPSTKFLNAAFAAGKMGENDSDQLAAAKRLLGWVESMVGALPEDIERVRSDLLRLLKLQEIAFDDEVTVIQKEDSEVIKVLMRGLKEKDISSLPLLRHYLGCDDETVPLRTRWKRVNELFCVCIGVGISAELQQELKRRLESLFAIPIPTPREDEIDDALIAFANNLFAYLPEKGQLSFETASREDALSVLKKYWSLNL